VTIRDELSVLNEQFADAFEDRDVDPIGRQFYDDDAVFLSQGTATVAGRDQSVSSFGAFPPSSGRTVRGRRGARDGDIVVDIGTLRAARRVL